MNIVQEYRERVAAITALAEGVDAEKLGKHRRIIDFHIRLSEVLTDSQLSDYLLKENPVAYTELGQLVRLIERIK